MQNRTLEQEALLTPQDLSAMLGVPVATLYRWRHFGDGPPSIRVGRHIRYRRPAVEEWLARQPESGGRDGG
jgi:excisionase family DNA binding protein